MSADRAGVTGPWTKLSILLQVVLVVVLAGGSATLVTWLSARPGLWVRWDTTAVKRNTLDPVLAQLISKLPRKATAEIFFRPLDKPLDVAGYEAQQRMRELLMVARNQMPHQLGVIDHDLSDLAGVTARMEELDVREPNVVVLTDGERRVVLRLLRDIARVDPGNPVMKVPPRLDSFLGDQAFGDALLQLAVDRTPKVLFSTGHGERALFGTEVRELGSLHSALVADGFVVGQWDPAEEPEIPGDCDVLAVIDPRQPFDEVGIEALRGFARRGGRLLVSPSLDRAALDGTGSMAEFLREYGILTQAGFIANPVRNNLGQLTYGDARCSILYVGPEGMDRRHPVTESLWSLQRRVMLPQSRAFLRGTAPESGVLLDVLRSSPSSWQDLPDPSGRHDWVWNTKLEEGGGFILAIAAAFEAPEGEGRPALAEVGAAERPQTRILALGCPDALGNGEQGGGPFDVNRDFALNLFNWLAERDHRLVIRPRLIEQRAIDLQNTDAQTVMNRVATTGLPGLCLALGLVVWWRRRK